LDGCFSSNCTNPQLRVQARVFYLSGDAKAGGLPTAPPADNAAVEYLGSTTGSKKYPRPDTCSPFAVTWNVSPACSPIKFASIKDFCAAKNVFAEDHAHGVRKLVEEPKLLSAIK
jgi:hypothetical protein